MVPGLDFDDKAWIDNRACQEIRQYFCFILNGLTHVLDGRLRRSAIPKNVHRRCRIRSGHHQETHRLHRPGSGSEIAGGAAGH